MCWCCAVPLHLQFGESFAFELDTEGIRLGVMESAGGALRVLGTCHLSQSRLQAMLSAASQQRVALIPPQGEQGGAWVELSVARSPA